MTGPTEADALLIDRIRGGEAAAWSDLIARYEGRLLAFVESRIGQRGPNTGQMPPLASSRVDHAGVDLLRDWCRSLKK